MEPVRLGILGLPYQTLNHDKDRKTRLNTLNLFCERILAGKLESNLSIDAETNSNENSGNRTERSVRSLVVVQSQIEGSRS